MSAFTASGRLAANTPPPGPSFNTVGIAPPSGSMQAPMQAPYPQSNLEQSTAASGSAGTANRHAGAMGHPFHLSPMVGQQQQQLTAPPPASGGIGGFNFQPIMGVPPAPAQQQQQQTPAITAAAPQLQQQQQATPGVTPGAAVGAGGASSADAMRDYVANLRAQVAGLKGEVDNNPAAARRLSGSAGVGVAAASGTLPPPTPGAAAGLPPPAPTPAASSVSARTPTPTGLQVHAQPAPTTTAQPAPSTATPAARRTSGTAAAHATSSTGVRRPSSSGVAGRSTTAAASSSSRLGSSSVGRSPSGKRGSPKKMSMSQRVVHLREELKEKEEHEQQLETELTTTKESLGTTSTDLQQTREVLFATDTNLRNLSNQHNELSQEHHETMRQLQSSNVHGETLEAQVSVFRRAKELEHAEDRLFGYFLSHCVCPQCIQEAAQKAQIFDVPSGVPEKHARLPAGLLASTEENQYHCAEKGEPIKIAGDGTSCTGDDHNLRIPHEVAVLMNKNFEELSGRADAQRSQIAQLQEVIKNRDEEITHLNENTKSLQGSLETVRVQHRAMENQLMLETAEKAAAHVRCDDAVRNVHLLKASLRLTLDENDKIAKELDKQLTRIQVIDANEAMHNNRHDEASRTIELRTSEIVQLRGVIQTMENNHNALLDENKKLRDAAQQLQIQIADMRTKFDQLSVDVSTRLQAQAQRVTEIEDTTMRLATTAVQAQKAEQEASKNAQELIDKLRYESSETQKLTANAVAQAHLLPSIILPAQAQTVAPAFVATTLPAPDEDPDQPQTAQAAQSSAQRNRSPNKNNAAGEAQPQYGPNSTAGRLGTALAESSAYATSPTHHVGKGTFGNTPPSRGEDQKIQDLLSPLKVKGMTEEESKPLDPAEQLAIQIRATLAVDADAKEKCESAIDHANATIGTN